MIRLTRSTEARPSPDGTSRDRFPVGSHVAMTGGEVGRVVDAYRDERRVMTRRGSVWVATEYLAVVR